VSAFLKWTPGFFCLLLLRFLPLFTLAQPQKSVLWNYWCFALPGTLAESNVKRKLQRESTFNSSRIQKTRLVAWDLNISNSDLPNQSSTTLRFGMLTPQTPLTRSSVEMDHTTESDTHIERENVRERDEEWFQLLWDCSLCQYLPSYLGTLSKGGGTEMPEGSTFDHSRTPDYHGKGQILCWNP